MKTTIVQADHRRLERALAVSVVLWALIFVAFSRIALKGPDVPRDSMNPLYVELAPPLPKTQEKVKEPPPTQIGGVASAPQGLGRPSAGASGVESVPQASTGGARDTASGSPSGPAAVYTLHTDPGSAPLPGQAIQGSAPRISSGTDQWAPLSEQNLAAQAPAAPAAPNTELASRGGKGTAQTTRPTGTAGASADTFDQTWSQTAQKLAPGSAGSAPADSMGTSSSTTKSGGSSSGGGMGGDSGTGRAEGTGGDVGGSIDFGSGSPRELWSPRRIRIPDALMQGKPRVIETRVSFTVERGGTVVAPTIRFDPPLPSDIDAYLRTAFSSWLFSPADSDGQARFSYSIKVR